MVKNIEKPVTIREIEAARAALRDIDQQEAAALRADVYRLSIAMEKALPLAA